MQSLDIRQLSRDGRMRNPDEKPLVLPEAPTVSRAEVPARANAKPVKEDHAPVDAAPIQKEQQEVSGKQLNDARGKNSKSTEKKAVVDDDEEIYGLDLHKDSKPKKIEIDEATLKEMKKEEEIAKNKQAMERKRKLAEKAAAKAAKKAQLEAEKKLKVILSLILYSHTICVARTLQKFQTNPKVKSPCNLAFHFLVVLGCKRFRFTYLVTLIPFRNVRRKQRRRAELLLLVRNQLRNQLKHPRKLLRKKMQRRLLKQPLHPRSRHGKRTPSGTEQHVQEAPSFPKLY